MDFKDSLLSISAIAAASFVVGAILKYGFNFAIARLFGPEILGTITFGIVIMNIISIFGRIGLEHTFQKLLPEYDSTRDYEKIFELLLFGTTVSFVVSSVFAAVAYVGILEFIRPRSRITLAVTLFIIAAPLFSIYFILANSLKGFKLSEHFLISNNLLLPAVALLSVIVTQFWGLPAYIISIGYAISILCGLLYTLTNLLKNKNIKPNFNVDLDYRRVLTFSIASLSLIGAQYLTSWTDILVLGAFRPAADIGVYQVAFQTASLVTLVLSGANSIFPPVASSLSFEQERERLNHLYSALTKWILLLSVLSGAYILINGRDILMLFGEDFSVGYTLLIVLVLANVAATSTGPVGFLLSMSGNERLNAGTTIAFSVVNLFLNLVLVPTYGTMGAAVATGVSLLLLNITRLIEVYLVLEIFPYTSSLWKGGVALGVSVSSILFIDFIPMHPVVSLLLSGSVSIVLFGIISAIIGFDETDKVLLKPIRRQ